MRRKIDTSTVLHCGFDTPWHEDRLRLPSVREKNLAPGVGTKAGIPEDTMGRSASGGLRTWLRDVCTTLSELQFEQGSLFRCSLHQALFRLRWISFRDHCCLARTKCLLEFARFSDLGLRFQSFSHLSEH